MRPWGGRLGRVQAATTALGGALIGLGWWGASGSAQAVDQMSWLTAAALGMVVAGLGQALFLLDAHRRVTILRLGTIVPVAGPVPATASGTAAPAAVAGGLVAVVRGRRYHRPDCHLVAGKAITAVPPVRVAGLVPCEICDP